MHVYNTVVVASCKVKEFSDQSHCPFRPVARDKSKPYIEMARALSRVHIQCLPAYLPQLLVLFLITHYY